MVDDSPLVPGEPDDGLLTGGAPTSRRRVVFQIAKRVLVMAIGLGVAMALMLWAFDDLDFGEVLDAVKSLDDAQIIALLSGTVIMVWAEALLTASVIEGLPARRGAMAWLGPNAVASIVPGPSDMPVRYRMLMSWGYDASTAGTGVAASGLLNLGIKIVFPAIAAVGLVVADVPLGRLGSALISGFAIIGLFLVVMVIVFTSESRTRATGRFLERAWGAILRLLRRRRPPASFAERIVEQRSQSIDLLRGRWIRAIASVTFVTVARVSLFVMCVRFVGVPESAVSWQGIFAAWAIERGLTIIPIMPGNAGLSELALTGLLTAMAGEGYVNQITAAVLIFRVLTWLLLIPVGGAALGMWRYGLRRAPPPPDSADALAT